MGTIHNAGEAVLVGLGTLFAALPRIVGALLILVIGWLIAGLLAKLVAKVLDKVGADRVTQRAGIDSFFQRAGVQNASAGTIIAFLVKWYIRLIVLSLAITTLGITGIEAIFAGIIGYVPVLIVAVLIIAIGAFVAKLAGEAVKDFARGANVGSPQLLGTVTQFTVLAFFVVGALQQAHIMETLVNELVITVLAIVAGASILAFGLGGREHAAKLLGSAYDKGQQTAQQAQQAQRSHGNVSSSTEYVPSGNVAGRPAPVQPSSMQPPLR
ncbi:MAG: hypothetical protein ABR541_07490 [Candidatus Dormibacteria bacterium]